MKLKCKVCEIEKESDKFFKDAGTKTGYRNNCKSCFKLVQKKYNNVIEDIDVLEGNKTCSTCKIEKSKKEFSRDKHNKDGLQVRCKLCAEKIRNKNKEESENVTKKTCKDCNKEKEINNFSKSKSGKFGYANECKDCRKIKRSKHNFKSDKVGLKKCAACKVKKDKTEFHTDKHNTDGLNSSCKKCRFNTQNKYLSELKNYFKKIFKDLRNNAKKRNIKVEITLDDIKELYDKQNGICIYTGEKMTHLGHQNKETKNGHIYNTNNISVDRIDSKKHYIKDNIQLVCAQVNRVKYDMNHDEFLDMVKKICVKHKL